MNVRAALVGTLFMVVLTGATFAQGARSRAVKFTSVYTSLGAGCKVLRGSNGSDGASICRGLGGYRVRVFSSAASTHIVAEIKGTDRSIPLATVSIGFNETRTRLEWRLANGKPFAVIVRIPRYGPVTDDNPYFGKVTGQDLVVSGLKGFDIDKVINANTRGAAAKARALADKGYLAERPKRLPR